MSEANAPPARCRQAIILAAGEGKRLAPLTEAVPKCLVRVGDETMLDRILDALARISVEEVVIVTGHLHDVLRAHVDSAPRPFTVEYVHSERYDRTNNVVSLWLAREQLRPPFILAESDLVFDADALEPLAVPDRMAVARWTPVMDGTVVEVDPEGNVDRLILKRDQRPEDDLSATWKTVNLYSFSERTWQVYRPTLDDAVSAGHLQDYYEAALGDLINAGTVSLKAVDFSARRWMEVDDLTDLARAEARFASPPT
jgi:L-glutamine-phosphate cytidylyltransferase